MTVLYVTERRAVVRKAASSLIVTIDKDPDGKGPLGDRREILLEVEPHRVEMVALIGDVHITSDATKFCLRRGIGLAWFGWNGRFLGRVVPEGAGVADLRLLQYKAISSPELRLAWARGVVAAKLRSGWEVLEDLQGNMPGSEDLSDAIRDMKQAHSDVQACSELGSLLGVEGGGARSYFGALRGAFRAEIGFSGRKRRPPPDPANSLLSFGYTLLTSLIGSTLEARGLDPDLGFFHEVRSGRPSLALDLLEEMRHPVVDRFVLRGCNLRIFRQEMFEPDPERPTGVILTRPGKKVFFREWESALRRPIREIGERGRISPQDVIRRQVDRLAAALRGREEYLPFRYGD